MNDIKIESNIPLPMTGKGGANRKYPFREMKVGDSFFVSGGCDIFIRSRIASAAFYFGSRNKDYRFSIRKDGDGLRVWRIPA